MFRRAGYGCTPPGGFLTNMASKSLGILERAHQERSRGEYDKALKRLRDGISKHPGELPLYREAVELCLEAGESMEAIQYFKRARRQFPDHYDELWRHAVDKVNGFNDAIFGKFLIDTAVKKRELQEAADVLDNLKDHTASELLKRTRTKKQTLSSAMGGGLTLKGELVMNAIAEALICLRVRKYQDAVKVFLQVLAEKPNESESIEPFFVVLDKEHRDKPGITYALGRCLLLSGKYGKAVAKIVKGVVTAPSFVPDAIAALEAVAASEDVPGDDIQLALARLDIMAGNEHRAAERIHAVLDGNSSRAPLVVDLLKPDIEHVSDNLLLHYLFIESALLANRNEIALTHVKKLYRVPRHRSDLVEWLDTKSQDRFMPANLLMYFGEISLEQKMFEKAEEIFREVLSMSANDAPMIASILEKYRGEPSIKRLHNTLVDKDAGAPGGDDGDIHHFDNKEFSLNLSDDAPAQPPRAPARPKPQPAQERPERKRPQPVAAEPDRGVHDGFDNREFSLGGSGEAKSPAPKEKPAWLAQSGFDNREFSLNMFKHDETAVEEPPSRPVSGDTSEEERPTESREHAAAETIEPRDADLDVSGRDAAGSQPETVEAPEDDDGARPVEDPVEPRDTTPEYDMSDVHPTVQAQPPATGAAPEDDGPAEETQEDGTENARSGVILLGAEDDGEVETPTDIDEVAVVPEELEPKHVIVGEEPAPAADAEPRSTPVEEPATREDPDSFETLLASFERGELERERIFDLIDSAFTAGEMPTVKRLLNFRPENMGEEIKRKFYLAEYYESSNQPLNALLILKTMSLKGLGKDERKVLLLKIAHCYEALGVYEAANGAYLRIISENPDSDAVENAARKNYERYLRLVSGGAPALEKVTSI